MRAWVAGLAMVLAAGCGGGSQKAGTTTSTSTTNAKAAAINTCNGRYPPDSQAWAYCVNHNGDPAPDYILNPPTTTTTTEPTSTTLAVRVNAEFVVYARALNVPGSDADIQTLGDDVCLFARKGAPVFRGYVGITAPAAGLPRQWFSSLMVAAAVKLCPDTFSVIQPEVQRLAGK